MQAAAFSIVSNRCVGCKRTAGTQRRAGSLIKQVVGHCNESLTLRLIGDPRWLLAMHRLFCCIPRTVGRADRGDDGLLPGEGRWVGIR